MKKTKILIFILLFIVTSACQTQRRGVKFYSGDKNTSVVGNQLSLTGQKKTEYEIKLRRLQGQRQAILASQKNEKTAEIKRLENENKRLDHELSNLQSNLQRITGDDLVNQIAEVLKRISSNEEKLQILYKSDDYPSTASNIDKQIIRIEGLLLELQINEDQMLVKMNKTEDLEYFQGNLRNGHEAANAYMLMKWAQKDDGQAQIVNHQKEETGFQALIINEWSRGVTVVIRHSSGFELTEVPIEAKSKMIINLPFPGNYTCYFKRGSQRGNYVNKNINPRLRVNHEGENYAFILTQRGW